MAKFKFAVSRCFQIRLKDQTRATGSRINNVMDQAQIKESIKGNLAAAGLNAEDIRVQPDPYLGWRIAVVSDDFKGLSFKKRKEMLSGKGDSSG